MRKLIAIALSVLCFLVYSGYANAKCVRQSCKNGSGRVWISEDQCFFCGTDPNSCTDGAVVTVPNKHSNLSFDYFQCNASTRSFFKVNVDNICRNSPIQNVDADNVHITYSSTDGKTIASSSGVAGGAPTCKYIYCQEPLVASADKKSCVSAGRYCLLGDGKSNAAIGKILSNNICNPKNASTGLSSMEHVKSGNVCTVECVAGGWNVKLNDGACESGYKPDKDRKRCVEIVSTANAQKECDAARNSGAYWNATNNRCLCEKTEHEWSASEKQCVESVEYKECKSVADAKWEKGACVCNDTKKVWDATNKKCVESQEARAKRKAEEDAKRKEEEARKQGAREEALPRIAAASDEIKKLREGLSVSVWKNKEGNFNTARLASDSIAGVVLGTVGGVVTSKVIKKNQLKGGFDDIKCTVGGQVVAGYGDDFQVGGR